jgi:HK97 family phage prohead protease
MNKLQSNFNFNLQFTKGTGAGKREIEGYASTSSEDRDGEYFPKELLEKAAGEYIKMGTLLFDHGNDPVYGRRTVGKLFEASVDEQGRMYVKGRISDSYIWEKIELGELQAFSIGGKASWETKEVGGKILGVATSLEIYEVSIVSVPANPEAIFSIAKSFELSYKQATDNLDNQNVYNKNIAINKSNPMEEMFKNITEKIDGLMHSDKEKQELKKSVETLETEKAELVSKVDTLTNEVSELKTSLETEKSNKESLEKRLTEIDEKLVNLIAVKKKAKTDDEVDKQAPSTDVSKDAINLAEETDKVYNAIFNR